MEIVVTLLVIYAVHGLLFLKPRGCRWCGDLHR